MKIEFLFPELVILYGESGNVDYLLKSVPGAVLIETSLEDRPAFAAEREDDWPDLVYIGSMEEEFFDPALCALRPYTKALQRYIDKGRVFFSTGNSIDLFGKTIENFDGRKLEGLGLIDIVSKVRRGEQRHNCWYLGDFEGMSVIATRSTYSRQYGGEKYPLFHGRGGIGMNDGTMQDGVRIKNFYATTLLGPFLIENPLFTKYLLAKAGYEGPLYDEKDVMDAYHIWLKRVSRPDFRFMIGVKG